MATDRLSATEEARVLVRNLREGLTYPMALERAAASASTEERHALRRLLTRAHQERGPQPAER